MWDRSSGDLRGCEMETMLVWGTVALWSRGWLGVMVWRGRGEQRKDDPGVEGWNREKEQKESAGDLDSQELRWYWRSSAVGREELGKTGIRGREGSWASRN